MKYTAICFDLDGTIMDTYEGVVDSLREAAEKMGIDNVPYDRPDLFIGPSNLQFAMNVLGLEELKAREYDALAVESYLKKGIRMSKPYDGIIELMRDLKSDGAKVFICTAKAEVAAIVLAKDVGFYDFLNGLGGSRDACDDKTSILARLLKEYEIDPSEAVMIGDRYTDLDGGRKNHTHTIGVTFGYGLIEELEECKPDYIAKNVEDLRDFLYSS